MAAAAHDVGTLSATLIGGTLRFLGHATVSGDFIGRTRVVFGELFGDLSNLGGWVEFPTATLDTGNWRRDRDMGLSLEADRYPTARLDVDGATLMSPGATWDGKLDLLVHGRLRIHGVTRAVMVPILVKRSGGIMDVTGIFPLDLADYHIGGLTRMFGLLSMDRRLEVWVNLRFLERGGRIMT